ncbi:hypothetical protein SAMN02910289_01391 [Lachnospiraceae bacterium RM5]|nr:hypothetical protein SAMN02910289_01391 [Lachnospiraceae bacterium RM5]
MLKDKDIREPLFEFLEENYKKIRIFEEKNIGRSRADIIMIQNSLIYGIEIKSDADTYVRLKSQIEDYDKFFDYNIIVVGSSHAYHVKEHIPEHWGIIVTENIDDKTDFYILREPEINETANIYNQLSFLWRPEIAHIQEINGLYKYAGKSKEFVINYLFESVEKEKLKRQITDELFERDYTKIFDEINKYREEKKQKARRRKKYKRRKKSV